MMIESGIHKLIVTDPRFADIADSRLYPILLPNDSPLPAATYQAISIKALYVLDARVNFDQLRFHVDTWGKTYGHAKDLASAVVKVLDGFSGALPDGSHVFGTQLRNSTDYYEHEALIYRVLIEFDIQFAQ